jgi:antitoxin CptB
MNEDRDTRIRRLRMRSMRRGIREMDLILIAFSDEALGGMSEDELSLYDAFLSENDHDLYLWIAGQTPAPARFGPLVQRISAIATGLTRPA